ncbi:5-(carboxyamino)imidazole ribonucleotide synthase [Natranaerobius trueperi]|uniref:N5-carboxyaminoimidazole ribonucleotide synthase n=1 Tax=Natranaerobius trueperi TaxID=759412 RepID=A0A226C2W4_9FIRM|nr:5-(carboxyamino)imidazole ribonucleotide synthase [Natranaerobius trueperi]OWZ84747.1 5-(carboxyamino)imidazole ribonucleotide synthase [Natranaerobius trueperi]
MNYEPGITLGIVGGGQLGRMLTIKAKELGLMVVVLDPKANAPAAQLADKHIKAKFDDKSGYEKLHQNSDIITFEFEHISAENLKMLENQGAIVRPGANTLSKIQDKGIQKEMLQTLTEEELVPKFKVVTNKKQAISAIKEYGYPVMVKLCTGGYDGKGNFLLQDESEIEKLNDLLEKHNKLLIEEYIDFEKEVSVMAAINSKKEKVTFPLVENYHSKEILHVTKAPAEVSNTTHKLAAQKALEIIDFFDDPGIYGIEFFLLKDGRLLVNEIAPRVHNSGHYTIESCNICQFSIHLRSILGLPLVDPILEKKACMINLLGTFEGKLKIDDFNSLFEQPNAYLHLYGKDEVKFQRKMGHVTLTGDDCDELISKANKLNLL